MKHVGEKIRSIREKTMVDGKKMTLRKLAELAHISPSFLSDIERGITAPSLDTLRKIALALNVPPSELLIDEDKTPVNNVKIYSDIIFVPLLSDATVACCGDGNSYEYAEEVIERMIPVIIDDGIRTKGMFAVRVEGDSMEDAGIRDGNNIVVAPEEEPMPGDVVFCCYGPNKKWLVRWWHPKPNGEIILKAANKNYSDVVVTKEEIEMGWFDLVGKVIAFQGKPRASM